MIEHVLASWVATCEAFDDADQDSAYPQERALVATSSPARRREFSSARRCADAALADLGIAPAPLLRAPNGAPAWPDGVVGSLTHSAGYCAGAVANARRAGAIGIDAEPDGALPAGVLERVASAEEAASIRTIAGCDPWWGRVLFSAKESVFKAFNSATGRWLDSSAVTVALHIDGRWTVRVRSASEPCGRWRDDGPSWQAPLTGRWHRERGLVLTALVLDPAVTAMWRGTQCG